jgi:hypothetical protein
MPIFNLWRQSIFFCLKDAEELHFIILRRIKGKNSLKVQEKHYSTEPTHTHKDGGKYQSDERYKINGEVYIELNYAQSTYNLHKCPFFSVQAKLIGKQKIMSTTDK